jgi:hypothetical protein
VDIDGRRVATEKQVVDEAADLPPDVAEATMEQDPDLKVGEDLEREIINGLPKEEPHGQD